MSKALENLKRLLDSDNKKVSNEQRSISFTSLSQQLADPSKSVMLNLIRALPLVGVLTAWTVPWSAVHGRVPLSRSLALVLALSLSLSVARALSLSRSLARSRPRSRSCSRSFCLRSMIKSKKY